MNKPKPCPLMSAQARMFANIELSICRAYVLTDAVETRMHRGLYVCADIPARHAEKIATDVVLTLAYISIEGQR